MQARALECVEVVANETDSNESVSALLDDELSFIGGGSPVVNAL